MLRTGPGAVVLLLRGSGLGPGGPGLRPLQFRERLPDPDVVVVGGRRRRAAQLAAGGPGGGVAGLPGLDPGLLNGPGPRHLHRGQLHRRPGRPRPGPRRPGRRRVQVLALPQLLLRLRGRPLGGQAGQRGGDPPGALPRPPRVLGHLVPGRPPAEQVILGGVGLGVRRDGLGRHLGQRLLGPVRRLRRIRGDLHPVQRHHPELAHAQPCAQREHLRKERRDRIGELAPEPGEGRLIGQVTGADHLERHVGVAQLLDPPRRGDLVRVRPYQHRHQHAGVIPGRPRPAGAPQRVERAGIQVIFHDGDHQPDRVTGRQPVPHRRREQERLVPVHRAVSLRHPAIIPNNINMEKQHAGPGQLILQQPVWGVGAPVVSPQTSRRLVGAGGRGVLAGGTSGGDSVPGRPSVGATLAGGSGESRGNARDRARPRGRGGSYVVCC
jgi:hypothetical protein